MGCGGTAASGHGLTGHQVLSALQLLVNQLGAEVDDTSLTDSDYAETRVQTVTSESPDGPCEVKVTEYYPNVFRVVRSLSGVSEEHFMEEWQTDGVEMSLGAGRSNALFFPSKGRVFLCKTIALSEVEVLQHILRSYTAHLIKYPDSFLTRFFLMMKVEVGAEKGYILCFHDVCAKSKKVHEKWDIKGRMPKPGKYQHDPDYGLPDIFKNDDDEPIGSPVCPVPDIKNAETTHGTAVKVKKDKDLNRLFWVNPATRNAILHQLHEDYEYLERAGLMDYSLFIAVSHAPESDVRLSTIRQLHLSSGAVEERGVQGKDEEQEPRAASASVTTLKNFSAGVPSLKRQEVYFIGIIDMLTEYTFKKKTANFFKSFLWTDQALSTIPPKAYRKRVERFSRALVPKIVADNGMDGRGSPVRQQ